MSCRLACHRLRLGLWGEAESKIPFQLYIMGCAFCDTRSSDRVVEETEGHARRNVHVNDNAAMRLSGA